MRKSGTEEQYSEKDPLLQEISQLADDFGHKVRLTAAWKVACACQQPSSISVVECSATSDARDTAAALHAKEADLTCVKRAAEVGNLAFFERRPHYEKSMRAMECSIEEQKIALAEQRLSLEVNQLESRRRQ
ncbi:uncharacterized protein [Dermacentor albipictus]|uniref:uncharacterized protein n=1 Tax=Dermacentor albipictus TaxID=60249 RepID=UPI0031FC8595